MRSQRWQWWSATWGCVTLVLAALASDAKAETTGNRYLTLSRQQQAVYVIGVLDGWETIDVFAKASNSNRNAVVVFAAINECVRKMTWGQIHAIVEKYLREHPEDWNVSASHLVYAALAKVCFPAEK